MASPTYQTLVAGLGLHPKTIAHRVFEEEPPPDWSVQPEEFSALVAPSTTASSKALLFRHANSYKKTFALTVIDNQVVVLHELKESTELDASGGQYLALAGDFRPVASDLAPPRYVRLPLGVTSHAASAVRFTTRRVPVQEWADIQTALGANGNLNLVTRAEAGAEGGNVPTRDVQLVLPVPPHVAVCFLTRMSVRAAFERGVAIRELIPEQHRNLYDPLFDFLRAAVTRSENEAGESAIQSEWIPLATPEGSSLEVRYYAVIKQLKAPEAPPNPAPPNGGAPVPPPPPPPLPQPEDPNKDKHKWLDFQLHKILTAAGHNEAELAVLTEASLPPVYQAIKEVRGSNQNARLAMEAAWQGWKDGQSRLQVPWVFSPALVQAIRTLDFDGGDPAGRWELRGKGLSYYSLAPVNYFPNSSYVQVMDNWKMYEQAEEENRLSLTDRQANRKVCELIGETPGTRMETLLYLETVADRLAFLFESGCKMVVYLRSFAHRVGTDPALQGWGAQEWLAFNWQVHIGIRRAFTKCTEGLDKADMHYLGRVQNDLQTGRKFDIKECPAELLGPKKRDATQAGLTPEKPTEPEAPRGKKPGAPAKQPVGHPMASNFTALMSKAKAAAKNKKKFGIGKVLKMPEDFSYVFGPEFMASLEGKQPCAKYFLGKCGSENCSFSHIISKNPEKEAILGMVKRFEEKVNAFIAAESGND